MQLSKRLEALANLAGTAQCLADVGCDHGYIPIYLLERRDILRGIAMDIGKGPLMRAQENIRKHGLEAYIETRISDGLSALQPGECDCILISGMGGPLMERILTEGRAVAQAAEALICQPQSDVGHFRRFLMEQEYEICREDMIYEDGKYYPMMKIVRGTADYAPAELRYGPRLLHRRHPVLEQFLRTEYGKNQQLYDDLESRSGERVRDRLQQLRQEQQLLEEALRYYEL